MALMNADFADLTGHRINRVGSVCRSLKDSLMPEPGIIPTDIVQSDQMQCAFPLIPAFFPVPLIPASVFPTILAGPVLITLFKMTGVFTNAKGSTLTTG